VITIFAKHPAWGAADNFYRAFKSCGYKTVLLCLRYDSYNRIPINEVTFLNRNNLESYLNKSDLLFFCSPVVIASIIKKIDRNFESKLKKYSKKIIFITGTDYIKNYKSWNKFLNRTNFTNRFCEAEMIKFNPTINKFLPHPMEYDLPLIKNKKITICHAPGLIERPEKKGTPIIISVIKELKNDFDFEYDHIVGVSLSECLKRKSKSHIFIDQINPDVGGIGKNGYEALSLNCITIASVNSFGDVPKDLRPPVINVNTKKELYNILKNFLLNQNLINEKINDVSKWKENINFKNTIKKLGY